MARRWLLYLLADAEIIVCFPLCFIDGSGTCREMHWPVAECKKMATTNG
jgi:hypothetical protein